MTPTRIRVNVGMILPKLLGAALGAALLLAPAAHADVLDPVDGVHVAAQDGVRLWNHVDAGLHYSLVDDAADVLASTDEQNEPFARRRSGMAAGCTGRSGSRSSREAG